MAQHMRREPNSGSLRQTPDKRHDSSIGHGSANLALKEVDEDKIWEGLNFQCTQFIHQVIRVQFQDRCLDRERVQRSRLGPRAIWIRFAWHNLNGAIFYRDILMPESERLSDAKTRAKEEGQQEPISDMDAGIQELLYLCARQRLWISSLSLHSNHSRLLRVGLSDAMQERLVAAAIGRGELEQRECWSGS